MRHITLAEVTEAVDRAVLARGEDYVYPKGDALGCKYRFADGQPGCLVGQALDYLGLLDLMVPEGEAYEDGAPWWENNEDTTISGLAEMWAYEVRFDDSAVRFLDVAQNRQDALEPWGQAREKAYEDVRYLARQGIDPATTVSVAAPTTEPELVPV